MEQVKGYRRIQSSELKEMGAWGTEWIHEKSGAKVCCIENPQDSNKVFMIGFCTPPENDCGIPHILEHSVLCGSDKFPLKDPFMELAKGSVNTFLNAFTAEDMTMYPVASQNEQDLYHLMDVYMDAVFHPNLRHDPRIMMQEGWHYELLSKEDPITIKGVVYNEMKGAYSSPDRILFQTISRNLFPDTPYRYESGGAPAAIPELTQEQFLDFHQRYYHPSNSYIYLYGDMKMEEYMTWLDEKYLSQFEKRDGYDVKELLPYQRKLDGMKTVELAYSVSEEQGEEEGYFGYGIGIRPADPVDYFGLSILEYILLEAQGAPLKKALTDAQLGKNVYGFVNSRAHQGYFSMVAKGVDVGRKEEFVRKIEQTLRELTEKGIGERQKLSAINRLEFRLREADYGTEPMGLVIGDQFVMSSWLYGEDPFQYLRFDDILPEIRRRAENGYFEELIRKYLLDCPALVMVVLKPEVDLAQKEDRVLAQKLADYKASLTEAQIEKMIEQTHNLQSFQEEEETEEAKKAVPHLRLVDMKQEAEQIDTQRFELSGVPCWYTEAKCSQILYLKAYLDLSALPKRLFPYASVLATVLGRMDTEHFSYDDLSSEINIRTGGIGINTTVMERLDGTFRPELQIVSKSLAEEPEAMAELIEEILLRTRFEDTRRLKEILNEEYTVLEAEVEDSGHAVALQQAMSHLCGASLAAQYLSGVDYIWFIKDLVKNFDDKKEEILEALEECRSMILCQAGLELAGGSTAENKEKLLSCMERLRRALPVEGKKSEEAAAEWIPEKCNEGLITPGQVQYVVQVGMYDASYNGSMLVARQILSLDYLWNHLRVLGGAYGAFSGFNAQGRMYFASYRDPNLASTLETYSKVPEYLENFDCSQEEMEKFVIGTIGGMDMPLTPALRISVGTARARIGQTQEEIQRLRDEVLGVTPAQIRELAKVVRQGLENSCICTVGSKEMLMKEKDRFDRIFEVL